MVRTTVVADEQPQLRLAMPADAATITAFVRTLRGEHYPNRLLYTPTDLAQAIERRSLVIALAMRPQSGEVIGMAALDCSPYGRIAELGMLMVLPVLRRQHVADDLRRLLADWARDNGHAGVYTEVLAPRTDAPDSALIAQAFAEREQAIPCGLALGLWPDRDGGRQSFVRYTRPRPADEAPVRCRLPVHHQAMAKQILDPLRCAVVFDGDGSIQGAGMLHAQHDPLLSSWVLTVPRIGADSAAQLRSIIAELQANPAVACAHLELPLAQAGAIALCELAEVQCFFFSTLTPQAFDGGLGLRLQWLAQPIDPTGLALLNPLARRIAEHQHREQQRVRGEAMRRVA